MMLITVDESTLRIESLLDIINDLDIYSDDMSFGKDIDGVHQAMFADGINERDCYEAFLAWASRYQPCLFGRLGAKEAKGVTYDICWVTRRDIEAGDLQVSLKIQAARRAWKDRASEGLASGFLIMFQHERLARAKPGTRLLDACQRASELYLVENAPLQRDTIYTEAIPLRRNGEYGVFKGGINIFYPGAHRTLNHDRRVPGGLLISVNSPGHLANSVVMRGFQPTLSEAVQWIYDVAMFSVGNGGVGHSGFQSNSWHNTTDNEEELAMRCPLSHRPMYIDENYSGRIYSATYHTDVLLPTDVTVNDELDPDFNKYEIWPWLAIDYISKKEVPQNNINYGLFYSHPILPEVKYHNPWPPRIAHNSPLFEY